MSAVRAVSHGYALGAALALAIVLALCAVPVHAQTGSITLTWTCVGDDSLTGTAAKYDMRWAISRPDTTTEAAKDAWWAGAVTVAGMPAPFVAGTTQSVTIPGFNTGTYYFVLRVRDEVPTNWSAFGNVAVKSVTDAVRPAPLRDLR